MGTPRFYAPQLTFEIGQKAVLPEKARHHAGRVLRMKAGESASLFDGRGKLATGPIEFNEAGAAITVQTIETARNESPVATTLVQALVAPEKMDWIVEKAVELGVTRIVVVPTQRSVTKLTGERLQKRLGHWRDVMISACEQSGRLFVPGIEAMSFKDALEKLQGDRKIILAPSDKNAPQLTALTSVAFAVGPEGGFDGAEIELAKSNGWTCAQIGPRVLRTETAGIVALTLANAASGDMKFS